MRRDILRFGFVFALSCLATAFLLTACASAAQGGDHKVLIGEAVDAHVHEGLPLLFFRSTYGSLAF